VGHPSKIKKGGCALSSFFSYDFVFNNVPSNTYGLGIVNLDTGTSDGDAGAAVEIYEKQVYRKSRPYFFGRSYDTPLEFEMTIASENVIDGNDRSLIESWLLGAQNYYPLQILQEDLQDVYFNVIFTKSKNAYAGNMNFGMVLHARCDAPWAWKFPQTLIKNYTGDVIVDETFTFYNQSAENDYMYPVISVTTNAIGDSVSITNITDSNREFAFTGLDTGETLGIDNYRQIITSSVPGAYRLGDFNKKWFRLLKGANRITLNGGISNFTMTYQLAQKVGG